MLTSVGKAMGLSKGAQAAADPNKRVLNISATGIATSGVCSPKAANIINVTIIGNCRITKARTGKTVGIGGKGTTASKANIASIYLISRRIVYVASVIITNPKLSSSSCYYRWIY